MAATDNQGSYKVNLAIVNLADGRITLALDPSDSPMFLRDLSSSDVYDLTLQPRCRFGLESSGANPLASHERPNRGGHGHVRWAKRRPLPGYHGYSCSADGIELNSD